MNTTQKDFDELKYLFVSYLLSTIKNLRSASQASSSYTAIRDKPSNLVAVLERMSISLAKNFDEFFTHLQERYPVVRYLSQENSDHTWLTRLPARTVEHEEYISLNKSVDFVQVQSVNRIVWAHLKEFVDGVSCTSTMTGPEYGIKSIIERLWLNFHTASVFCEMPPVDLQASCFLLLRSFIYFDDTLHDLLSTRRSISREVLQLVLCIPEQNALDGDATHADFMELVERATAQAVTRRVADCISKLKAGAQRLCNYFQDLLKKKLSLREIGKPIFLPNFYVSSTWALQAIENRKNFSMYQGLNEIVYKRLLNELLLAISGICVARGEAPYICTSLSMVELEFIKCSVEDHLSTSFNVRPSLHDIYSTIVSMRRVFGSSHMDFCLALSHTVEASHANFPSVNSCASMPWNYDTRSLCHLAIKVIRTIEWQSLPRFDIQPAKIGMFTLLGEKLLELVPVLRITETSTVHEEVLTRTLAYLLSHWGPTYVNFCCAELYYDPARTPKLTERSTIIHDALEYLEREVLACDTFFSEWGSDILVSFYFFSINAQGRTREYCLQATKRVATHWLQMHKTFDASMLPEDILYSNEALYALKRMSFDIGGLENCIRSAAPRWHLYDYIGISKTTPLSYDLLNSVMIWSFFFRGTEMKVEGICEEAVENMCTTSVESLEREVGILLSLKFCA